MVYLKYYNVLIYYIACILHTGLYTCLGLHACIRLGQLAAHSEIGIGGPDASPSMDYYCIENVGGGKENDESI